MPQFRNPRASLRIRLCDLLGHLQRSGERDCQEFYRALYIHAQPLHSRLPSRHSGRKCTGLSVRLLSQRPPATPSPLCGPRAEGGFWPHRYLCLPVSVSFFCTKGSICLFPL